MKFLVAVDDSPISHTAFESTLALVKPRKDELFILSVIPTKSAGLLQSLHLTSIPNILSSSSAISASEELKEGSHSIILGKLDKEAEALGVKHSLVLAEGKNIGEEICKYVKELGINFLVLGKEVKSGIVSKWLSTSVTDYCVANAECNVLVVKGEYLPMEIQGKIKGKEMELGGVKEEEEIAHEITRDQVKKMEEEERKRRLREERVLESESGISREELQSLEEEERKRRLREDGERGEKNPEKINLIRGLSQDVIKYKGKGKGIKTGRTKLIRLEEEERRRRLKEEGAKGEKAGEKLKLLRSLSTDIITKGKANLKLQKGREEIGKIVHDLTVGDVNQLEEEERKRRLREEGKKGEKVGEKTMLMRQLSKEIKTYGTEGIGSVEQGTLNWKKLEKLEEKERERRVEEANMAETEESGITIEDTKRIEEEERQRRLNEEGKMGEKAQEKLELLHKVAGEMLTTEFMGKSQWDKKSGNVQTGGTTSTPSGLGR